MFSSNIASNSERWYSENVTTLPPWRFFAGGLLGPAAGLNLSRISSNQSLIASLVVFNRFDSISMAAGSGLSLIA